MRCFTVRTAALVLIVASAAAASAQSLADVSRQEEERRRSIGAPGKVYTNDHLLPAPPVTSVPAAAPGATTSGQPTASATTTPEATGDQTSKAAEPSTGSTGTPKTEEAWRARIATERDAVSRTQLLADAMQSRINALTTDFENRDDPAQRSVIASDRQKALAELDRLKKEVEDHRKAIATIQEEARRAGVPAGWTR